MNFYIKKKRYEDNKYRFFFTDKANDAEFGLPVLHNERLAGIKVRELNAELKKNGKYHG